jgi:hypothetical protein
LARRRHGIGASFASITLLFTSSLLKERVRRDEPRERRERRERERERERERKRE